MKHEIEVLHFEKCHIRFIVGANFTVTVDGIEVKGTYRLKKLKGYHVSEFNYDDSKLAYSMILENKAIRKHKDYKEIRLAILEKLFKVHPGMAPQLWRDR